MLRLQKLVPTAVEGTRNVINAAADAGVRRVVFTSSYGAVHMDPNRSPDTVLDESCWSDYDYCKQTGVSVIKLDSMCPHAYIFLASELNKPILVRRTCTAAPR